MLQICSNFATFANFASFSNIYFISLQHLLAGREEMAIFCAVGYFYL